jgi:hypothetical protein
MPGLKSDLIDFDLTREACFICGKPATTVEHVIPKWLQRKFNLWDQKITISNLTEITYKQLIVPACKKCNNEVYGTLEDKINNNTADEKDVWRWANKIHFGLNLKDRFLDYDRKNPGKKVSDVYESTDYLEESRHFLHCVSGDYKCTPDPFGSVFKFEFKEEHDFNLIHINNSNGIYICIGKIAYVVFVTDGQFLKTDVTGIIDDYNEIINRNYIMADALFFYAKCVYYLEQYTYSIPIIFTGQSIGKLGRATLRKEKPLDKPLFRAICDRFGITWVDKDEIGSDQ